VMLAQRKRLAEPGPVQPFAPCGTQEGSLHIEERWP
jgi:hypothetical protein